MVEKKIIDVEVRETGLDELNDGLKQTEQEVSKTGSSIEKVTGNGGAIAVLDSLTGGLATKFRDLYESTKLFNLSLKGTKTALIATGVGAFVVAVGLLVAYWDDIVDLIEGANKQLEKQQALIEKQLGYWNAEDGLLQAQIKLAEAEGKSVENLIKQRENLIKLRIEKQKDYIETLGRRLEEEESDAKRLTTWEKISGLYAYVMYGAKVEGQVTPEEKGALDEFLTKSKEAETELTNLQLLLNEIQNPPTTPTSPTEIRGADQDSAAVSPLTGLALPELEGIMNAEFDAIKLQHHARRRLDEETAQFTEEMEKRKSEARFQALNDSAQALMAFGDLVGQSTGAGKALASAGALINTYLGITEVLSTKSTLPEPFATISRIANIATVAASGFAAVRNINAVQIPQTNISSGFFSGRGGSGGNGGATVQTPDFNIVGNSGVNQLAEVINEREQQPVRAYVVSSDVRSQDELDRTIRTSSSL